MARDGQDWPDNLAAPTLTCAYKYVLNRCTLSGMADDFQGVPAREWHEAMRDAGLARTFAWIALWLVALLVFTLIERGVLAGWSDLFRPVSGPAGA